MKAKNIKLTESEIDHIYNLICENEKEEGYWGNKKYYWNRSARIKDKLKGEDDENKR
jgi:hypothetical protein